MYYFLFSSPIQNRSSIHFYRPLWNPLVVESHPKDLIQKLTRNGFRSLDSFAYKGCWNDSTLLLQFTCTFYHAFMLKEKRACNKNIGTSIRCQLGSMFVDSTIHHDADI
jgi:hypothetical protein